VISERWRDLPIKRFVLLHLRAWESAPLTKAARDTLVVMHIDWLAHLMKDPTGLGCVGNAHESLSWLKSRPELANLRALGIPPATMDVRAICEGLGLSHAALQFFAAAELRGAGRRNEVSPYCVVVFDDLHRRKVRTIGGRVAVDGHDGFISASQRAAHRGINAKVRRASRHD